MDFEKLLADILQDDPLGLIGEVKAKESTARTEEERLIASFEEINVFFEKHQRAPEKKNIQESSLFYRLKGLRSDVEKQQVLRTYDRFKLLPAEEKADYSIITLPTVSIAAEPATENIITEKKKPIKVDSIEDILGGDDILGIFEEEGSSIFDLQHVPAKSTTMPDYIARRKPCKDFKKFEPILTQCQVDLASKKRKLFPFKKEQQIEKGNFFVLKGVLLYIAKVGQKKNKKGKVNARLRCIFENGTESDMLLRSLAAELYKDGRRVTENEEKLLDNFKNITDEDKETGYIYVLKSLSTNPQISSISNLYKIGYSSTAVEDRIKNAEKEPTYLMAAVEIVTAYKCYNMIPAKLEQLLHRFFGNACLNVDLYDADDRLYRPREWFVAPFEIIDQAVGFILTGDIVDFRYDLEKGEIVGR